MDAQTPVDDLPEAPSELKPISGLAVTAFILSFICGFVSIAGAWMASLIPIVLAIVAIVIIAKTGRRGRILAIFAIIVAGAFGSCSYMLHTQGTEVYAQVPRRILTILADETKDAAAKDEALKGWAYPAALEANAELTAGWRAGFDALVAEHGAWSGELEFGDHVPGFFAVVIPPPKGEEIRPTTDDDPPAGGGAIWVKVPFAKATVWMCVALGTGQEDAREAAQDFKEDAPSPVVGAIRWFRLE